MIRFTTVVRNAMMSVIDTAANAGSGPATLRLYSGSQPSSADTVPTGTLLATFTLTDPAFEPASNGVIALDANPDINTVASATGTVGWARLCDSNGVAILDGSVGVAGDFQINTTQIVAGSTVILATASFSYPA